MQGTQLARLHLTVYAEHRADRSHLSSQPFPSDGAAGRRMQQRRGQASVDELCRGITACRLRDNRHQYAVASLSPQHSQYSSEVGEKLLQCRIFSTNTLYLRIRAFQAVVCCFTQGEDLAFQAFHPLVLGRMPVAVEVPDHRFQAALQQFGIDCSVVVYRPGVSQPRHHVHTRSRSPDVIPNLSHVIWRLNDLNTWKRQRCMVAFGNARPNTVLSVMSLSLITMAT